MNYTYDYIINNNGTLDELEMRALTFIESVKLTNKNKENLTPYEVENGKEEKIEAEKY